MKPLIVFLHIPKTGGSTMRRYLEMAYGERYLLIAGRAQLDAIEDWSQIDAIAGHITAAEVQSIPRDTRVFTLLRNPVNRLVSLYRWWRDHDRFSQMEAIRNVQHLTFEPFLDHQEYWAHTRNGITRQLSEKWHYIDDDTGWFRNAAHFLDSCELVGTFDRHADFVARMAQALDWSFPIGDVHEKRVSGTVEVCIETRLRLVQENPLDFALWQYAKTLFEV